MPQLVELLVHFEGAEAEAHTQVLPPALCARTRHETVMSR
jgi:hypothetical protein